MKKPKYVAMRGPRTGVHLQGTSAIGMKNPVTKARGKIRRSIGTPAIHDDDLGLQSAGAKLLQEFPDERRFV
jgi:hypothetical protein